MFLGHSAYGAGGPIFSMPVLLKARRLSSEDSQAVQVLPCGACLVILEAKGRPHRVGRREGGERLFVTHAALLRRQPLDFLPGSPEHLGSSVSSAQQHSRLSSCLHGQEYSFQATCGRQRSWRVGRGGRGVPTSTMSEQHSPEVRLSYDDGSKLRPGSTCMRCRRPAPSESLKWIL